MSTDDVVTILEAVGDSWPAAIVIVAGIAGFIAVRALPRLKDIAEGLKAVRHEFGPNSGKTLRDAVDRLERGQETNTRMLAEHIAEDQAWKTQAEDLLTRED